MKSKKKLLVLMAFIALSLTSTTTAQLNFDFNTAEDVAKWPGFQANTTLVDNMYMQLKVIGDFWAVATYEPAGGINWDCDNNKAVVIKVKNATGDFSLKGFSTLTYKDYELKDPQPIPIPNSSFKFHVIAFENYASAFPELQSGVFPFQKMFLTMINVNPGDLIQVDWVKSFPTLDSAYNYIEPLMTGSIALKYSPIKILSINSNILISGMEKEDLVCVYDAKGILVESKKMKNGQISNMKRGFYIVKTGATVSKITI